MSNTAKELRDLIAKAQIELSKIERRPVEPEDSHLITFEVQFTGYGQVYTFAAIKADGRWYPTGRNLPKYFGSWEEIFDYFEARGTVSNVKAAIDFRPVLPFVSDAVLTEARALAFGGKKIQAIKHVRTATGMGLREAKDYVDQMSDYGF